MDTGLVGDTVSDVNTALSNEKAWYILVDDIIKNAYKNPETNETIIRVVPTLPEGNANTPGTIEYIKAEKNGYYFPSNLTSDTSRGYMIGKYYWFSGSYCLNCIGRDSNHKYGKFTQSGLHTFYLCPVAILPSDIQVTSTTVGTKTVWNVITDTN